MSILFLSKHQILKLVFIFIFLFSFSLGISKDYLDAKRSLSQPFENMGKEYLLLNSLQGEKLSNNEILLLQQDLASKKPLVPVILNIFFGGLGIGNFVQGDTKGGFNQLILTGIGLLEYILGGILIAADIANIASGNIGALSIGGFIVIAAGGVTLIANWIIGLIRPFAYYKAIENRFSKIISTAYRLPKNNQFLFANHFSNKDEFNLNLNFKLFDF